MSLEKAHRKCKLVFYIYTTANGSWEFQCQSLHILYQYRSTIKKFVGQVTGLKKSKRWKCCGIFQTNLNCQLQLLQWRLINPILVLITRSCAHSFHWQERSNFECQFAILTRREIWQVHTLLPFYNIKGILYVCGGCGWKCWSLKCNNEVHSYKKVIIKSMSLCART